jgi:hypothetical protein
MDCHGRRFSSVPPFFVGGRLVATGFFAWLGALLLAGFTVAATLLRHRFWLRHRSEFRHQLTTSLEHVAIVGGRSTAYANVRFRLTQSIRARVTEVRNGADPAVPEAEVQRPVSDPKAAHCGR